MKTKQLPAGWKEVEFQEISDKNHPYSIGDGDHGQIKPSMYQDYGIPYIRVADLVNGKISFKKIVYIPEEVHQKNIGDELIPGDLLIAKTGATIGKVAIIPQEIKKANTTASIGKITLNKSRIEPKFMLYFLKTRNFKDQMWAVSKKSAQPGFNINDMKRFKIPLPSLSTQKKIVQILEEAEQLKQKRDQADKLMDDYLKSVFNEMFLRKDFEEVELGEIFEIKKGNTITKNLVTAGTVPVIAGGQSPAYDHNESNRQGETITVSGSGAYAGFVNYFDQPIFASDCTTLQDKNTNEMLTIYGFYFLKSKQNFIYNLQKGIAQPHVYPKDIMNLKIPFPPLALQKKFASIVEKVEKIKEAQKKSKQEIDDLFNALMQKAFRGEIR